MSVTPQDLVEADRCFQHVADAIRIDEVSPRSVLFGSTLRDWLDGSIMRLQIVVTCEPPNSNYKRAKLPR